MTQTEVQATLTIEECIAALEQRIAEAEADIVEADMELYGDKQAWIDYRVVYND